MPHHFLNRQVETHQQRLLRAGYKCVLFAESDEMIIASPELYPGGLRQYLAAFVSDDTRRFSRVSGYQIAHLSNGEGAEPEINWSKSLLSQRNYSIKWELYDKPLLSKVPLRYAVGHHTASSHYSIGANIPVDKNLILVHLHYIDKDYCGVRELAKFNGAKTYGKKDGFGVNSLVDDKVFSMKKQCCLSILSKGEVVSCANMQAVEVEKEKMPLSWASIEM
jgi:hypothetical protein